MEQARGLETAPYNSETVEDGSYLVDMRHVHAEKQAVLDVVGWTSALEQPVTRSCHQTQSGQARPCLGLGEPARPRARVVPLNTA